MEIVKVIVDRQNWYRGYDHGCSRLLITQLEEAVGKMCCLGFVCLAMGCTKEDIENMPSPHGLSRPAIEKISNLVIPNKHRSGGYENNEEVNEMIDVNDDSDINDTEREGKLINIGKRIGLDMSFVN